MLRSSRRLSAVLGAAASLTLLATIVSGPAGAQAPAAPVQGAEENLGYPIASKVLSPESSLGTDARGRPLAFWVTNGNQEIPGMFQVTDVFAGEIIFKQRVPEGINSWANAFSEADGRVYFAMTEGNFYSWGPGDTEITDHGVPFPGEGIWRLAVAPDGTVYGGTYPSGLLFSFDPQSGDVTNLGQVNPGETYVRSIAVDDEHVYVGSQPNAKLTRYDRVTGETTEVQLPVTGQSTVYDQTLAGDYLFVRIEPSNTMVVLRTEDLSVVNTVEKITGRVISEPDPTGRYVYFRLNNGVEPHGVYKYDLQTHTYAPTGFTPNAFPGAFAFVEFPDQQAYPGYSLLMTYYNGRIYSWNETTRKGIYLGESIMEGAPNPIQTIGAGPDGKIYASGFLSPPGMAQLDLATDTYTLLGGAGQVEGIGTFDERLVLGRYPNADLLSFDTTAPWKSGTNPGPPVAIGSEQDRPHHLVQVGDRVAVSTAPKSGRLGGAITLWNPETNEREVHVAPVPDQSVVSLAEREGMLYGGTSINGGYGIDPVADEAELFGFDPETGEVTFSTVPVSGAESVNALTFDDAGLLWGIAEGVVFVLDPATGEVTRSGQVFARSGGMYGTGRGLVFRDDGFLYGVSGGQLRRIDPVTLESVQLARTGVNNLVEGPDGNLYYSRIATLYRWNFDLPSEQPVVVTPGAVTFTDAAGTQDDTYTVPAVDGVQYLVGGVALDPGTYPGQGTVTVTARAAPGFELADGAVAEWSYAFSAVEPEPAEMVTALVASLEGYVASGAVAGPIAHQLTNAAAQAQRHLEGERTAPAARALERFVKHLDNPKRPDRLAEEAREDLNARAVAVLDRIG